MQKILIVEDSEILTKILLHLSRNELNFDVVMAKTFAEAKEKCEAFKDEIFAAIVDLNLPDAPDGEVVEYTLKQNISTIVLTGSLDDERRKALLNKGIVDYVAKEGRFSYLYAVRLVNRLKKNQAMQVLVVEDSTTMRKYICNLLKRHHFNVLEAEDGVEATRVLLSNPDIKLLITDYNMPNMDGFELIKNIRCKYEKFDLIVIGLSAEGEGNLSAKFIKSGANDFLPKPFNPEEFYCRIIHNIEALELVDQIRDVANRDYFTNLYSRRYFFQNGEELWTTANETNKPLSLAVINIDNFKALNDTYGNLFADNVLKTVAGILEKTLFRFLLARSSGKEFYVLMQGLDSRKAMTVMDKICTIISKEDFPTGQGKTHFVTCSIGVSDRLGECLQDQIVFAENAMKRAKDAGKNIVFSDEVENEGDTE